jgi:hypothetical protein
MIGRPETGARTNCGYGRPLIGRIPGEKAPSIAKTQFDHQLETGWIMKRSYWQFAIVFLFLAALALPAPTVKAHEADNKPLILAASQSDKQKHDRACRARYRDCLSKNQIPAFECQYIYQDCLKNMI